MSILKKGFAIFSLILLSSSVLSLSKTPSGKKWVAIPELSDEFGNGFNTNKWAKNDPQWAGRKPGLFTTGAVSVQNGNLRITAGLLPAGQRRNGYTYQGGLVRSLAKAPASYGGYFKASMKANKTFMSSTVCLIN